MNYFGEYRKAHDEMAEDVNIPALQKNLVEAQDALAAVTQPYFERIQHAEEGIKETVLDQQRTMVLNGIEATYSKPRKSTSWKGVAMTFDPPAELIEEHSKVGNPSVRIKVQEIQHD